MFSHSSVFPSLFYNDQDENLSPRKLTSSTMNITCKWIEMLYQSIFLTKYFQIAEHLHIPANHCEWEGRSPTFQLF